jgi:hypothetical protein
MIGPLRAFPVLLLGALAACGAPGEAVLFADPAEAVPGCRILRPDAGGAAFDTRFYHTTLVGSAIVEGATLGVREGLSDGGGVGTLILMNMRPPDRVLGEPVIWRRAVQPAFCLRVAAPPARARAALDRALRELRPHGYRVLGGGEVRSTSFVPRAHRAARWMDRFRAEVRPDLGGGSILAVARDVVISRRGEPYVEATSRGRLETSILTRARDLAHGGR